MPLQKIFQACTHYESSRGDGVDGELSVAGLSLALIMVAQKIQSDTARTALERVVVLFNRINAAAGSTTFASRLGPPGDSLLAVPRASAVPRRSSSASALQRRSADRLERTYLRDGANLSWAEMMAT